MSSLSDKARSWIEKFNQNHGADGRFSSGPGGSSGKPKTGGPRRGMIVTDSINQDTPHQLGVDVKPKTGGPKKGMIVTDSSNPDHPHQLGVDDDQDHLGGKRKPKTGGPLKGFLSADAISKDSAEFNSESENEMPDNKFSLVFKSDGSPDLDSVPAELRPIVEAAFQAGGGNQSLITKTAELEAQIKIEKAERLKIEKDLAVEREARVTREYVAKAEEFSALPIKADDLGLILKDVAEHAPLAYEKLQPVLKAANEAIQQSALFVEWGSNTQGDASNEAWAEIEKAASGIVQKSANVTKAEAIKQICEQQPELYARYEREREAAERRN